MDRVEIQRLIQELAADYSDMNPEEMTKLVTRLIPIVVSYAIADVVVPNFFRDFSYAYNARKNRKRELETAGLSEPNTKRTNGQ